MRRLIAVLIIALLAPISHIWPMESRASKKKFIISAGEKQISIKTKYALHCATLQDALGKDGNGNTPLCVPLELASISTSEELNMIRPYFKRGAKLTKDALEKKLQSCSLQELATILNAFNFLNSEKVCATALEVAAQKLLDPINFFSCLRDQSGSFNLPLNQDMQRTIAQQMLKFLPGFKTKVLLYQQLDANNTTLPSFSLKMGINEVKDTCFSPDGTILATSEGKIVRLWDTTTNQQIEKSLQGHTDLISSLSFSPDSKQLASGSIDRTIRLWDIATHTQSGSPLIGHANWVNSISFSPQGTILASASDDETICLWNPTTHEQIGRPLTGHTASISSVCFNSKGTHLVSTSFTTVDPTIRIWEVNTGCEIMKITVDNLVNFACFSPDGNQLVSTSILDNALRFWNSATFEPIKTFSTNHQGCLHRIHFNPDGSLFSASSDDNAFRIFDNANQNLVKISTKHPVRSLCFSPDGMQLAVSATNRIELFALADKELAHWFSKEIKPEQIALIYYLTSLKYATPVSIDNKTYPGWAKIILPQSLIYLYIPWQKDIYNDWNIFD